MEGQRAVTGTLSGATCVLWHPPGLEPAAELTAALAGRGVASVRVQSPFLALAEVCHLRRTIGRAPLVLLLVEPSRLADADAVVRCCQEYAPRTVCWIYEANATSRLRAVALDQLVAGGRAATPKPVVVVPPNPAAAAVRTTKVGEAGQAGNTAVPPRPATAGGGGSAPQLRLSGEGDLDRRGQMADGGATGAGSSEPAEAQGRGPRRNGSAQLLTQEELAMLLAEDRPE